MSDDYALNSVVRISLLKRVLANFLDAMVPVVDSGFVPNFFGN